LTNPAKSPIVTYQRRIPMENIENKTDNVKESQENNNNIEEIVLQWIKEFERTTGIQARVFQHSDGNFNIFYMSDEGPVYSYYDINLFLSAISTLKNRPSILKESPTECMEHAHSPTPTELPTE
jgi:hypothetical protein